MSAVRLAVGLSTSPEKIFRPLQLKFVSFLSISLLEQSRVDLYRKADATDVLFRRTARGAAGRRRAVDARAPGAVLPQPQPAGYHGVRRPRCHYGARAVALALPAG